MIDAGLAAPFIGRVRREATGGLSEGGVRRLATLRTELEELDRRRGTILRILEGPSARSTEPEGPAGDQVVLAPADSIESVRFEGLVAKAVPPAVLEQVRSSTDRFELEDLFLPYRRPEPEVQLALDRGLGALADRLVAPLPPSCAPSATSRPKRPPPRRSRMRPTRPTRRRRTPHPRRAPRCTPRPASPRPRRIWMRRPLMSPGSRRNRRGSRTRTPPPSRSPRPPRKTRPRPARRLGAREKRLRSRPPTWTRTATWSSRRCCTGRSSSRRSSRASRSSTSAPTAGSTPRPTR